MQKCVIKGKPIDGQEKLIAVSIMGKNLMEIEKEMNNLMFLKPDIIEWRCDYFEQLLNMTQLIDAAIFIREHTQHTPLIFTCRNQREGGRASINNSDYYRIIDNMVDLGVPDCIDMEISLNSQLIEKVRKKISNQNIQLIMSYHNFQKTPPIEELMNVIKQGLIQGGTLIKIATMINDYQDLYQLQSLNFYNDVLKNIPKIIIGMGEMGQITRIYPEVFGSCITFASNVNLSAPGQLSIRDLREIWRITEK